MKYLVTINKDASIYHDMGWGTIVEIASDSRYPIRLLINGFSYSFTLEGKFKHKDLYQTIFWDNPKFEIPIKPEVA